MKNSEFLKIPILGVQSDLFDDETASLTLFDSCQGGLYKSYESDSHSIETIHDFWNSGLLATFGSEATFSFAFALCVLVQL